MKLKCTYAHISPHYFNLRSIDGSFVWTTFTNWYSLPSLISLFQSVQFFFVSQILKKKVEQLVFSLCQLTGRICKKKLSKEHSKRITNERFQGTVAIFSYISKFLKFVDALGRTSILYCWIQLSVWYLFCNLMF